MNLKSIPVIVFVFLIGFFIGLFVAKAELTPPFVSAVATVIIGIFAVLTGIITYQQHKMYHDPDLRIYPLRQYEGISLGYGVILVNPGRVPITITEIEDPELEKDLDWNFVEPPLERPAKMYMQQLPWVIEGSDLAICRKFIRTTEEKYRNRKVKVKFHYYVDGKLKKETKKAPIIGIGPQLPF